MKYIHSKFKLRQFLFFAVVLLLAACHKDPFDADSGTFTDKRDGHAYKWVKIGDQIWMAENLAFVPYICAPDSQCGIWIYGYEGEGAYGTNYSTYGCLYDYKTALEVCPEGWHLPSDEEWMELERFLGMEERELELHSCRGMENNIAAKLISNDKNLWTENYTYNNETGFSALPGGERNIRYIEGKFYYNEINYIAAFWTNTIENEEYSINRTISSCIDRMLEYKKAGFSVRCIKD